MSNVTLDWSSAKVRDGKLEVELRGELPSGWKDAFGRTVELLPGGDWGKVSVKKDRVRVDDVSEGGVDRLHHFLESVVMQANAAHDQSEAEAHEDHDQDESELEGADAEMTERFRSFSDDDTEDDDHHD